MRRIDDLEAKETMLMLKLQNTIKAKEDMRLNYARVTGYTSNPILKYNTGSKRGQHQEGSSGQRSSLSFQGLIEVSATKSRL